jgi:hypothetical protein
MADITWKIRPALVNSKAYIWELYDGERISFGHAESKREAYEALRDAVFEYCTPNRGDLSDLAKIVSGGYDTDLEVYTA